MYRSPSPTPGKQGTRRLKGIVGHYIRKQLPAEQHGMFKAIRALHDDGKDDEAAEKAPTIATKEIKSLISTEFVRAVPEIVEVLAPDSNHNTGSSTKKHFLSEAIYLDVDNQKFQLEQAVKQYERMTAGSELKAGLDLKGLTTWDDVCAEVDHAHERYEEARGVFASIRKGFRKLGKHQEALDTWLQLLPSSNEYLSLMCGGLKLVISAAGRLKEMDDTVAAALTEIPSLLLNTQEVVGVFEPSNQLRGCAADLYVSVLGCIHQMVAYFSQKAQKQLFKAFFKPDSYQEALLESVSAMKGHADSFAGAAQRCHYKTSMDTNTSVRALQTMSLETNIAVSETLEMMKFCKGIFADFLCAGGTMDFNSGNLRPQPQSMRKAASSENMVTLKERARSREALLDELDTEDLTTANDISTHLRTAWRSKKDEKNRIMALMHDSKLHQWIVAPCSAALFVNGNCATAAQQSPVSYVSAKLAESISSQPSKSKKSTQQCIRLSFFCGEHTHRKDPDRGPDGLMRNLIAQLLLAYTDFELDSVRKIRKLDYEDIDDLCDIFEDLVMQLPGKIIVFCIIDGVGVLEEVKAERRDAMTVMEALVNLTEVEDEMCTFKVLVTSTWNSGHLYKEIPDQKHGVIWMPSKISNQGALTAAKLEFGSR